MTASAHIVHKRKKFKKQKCLVSLGYTWNVLKFLLSDQHLGHQSQKTNFMLFHISWLQSTEADILSATMAHSEEFRIFFLHRCTLKSHAFPLKVRNPKKLMSVASQGRPKVGGLIGPPLHLDISLNAYTDRVKGYCHEISFVYVRMVSRLLIYQNETVEYEVPYEQLQKRNFTLANITDNIESIKSIKDT